VGRTGAAVDLADLELSYIEVEKAWQIKNFCQVLLIKLLQILAITLFLEVLLCNESQ
jgi:hypothetical protein